MIIFLYGKDSYRIREKIREIVEKYKKTHKSGLDLKSINSFTRNPEKEFIDFENSIKQASMFKERKLLVIQDPFSNPSLEQEILKNKKVIKKGDDVVLVFKQGKADFKSNLAKFLKKEAKCQKFDLLEKSELKRWALKETKKNGGKIFSEALDNLIGYVGNDLWRLSQEINKLANYRGGEEITSKDVEFLVKQDIETDIFKTIDAMARKNKKKTISLLHGHLEKGDSPLYLLAMMAYQFRNILLIKDLVEKKNPYALLLKKSGLHPFVFNKSYSQSRQFSFEGLKKIYRMIFKVDLDIKTGQVAPELALDMLVAEI